VAGSCEYGDEPSGSRATELVFTTLYFPVILYWQFISAYINVDDVRNARWTPLLCISHDSLPALQ
jgi:hypothetical protein